MRKFLFYTFLILSISGIFYFPLQMLDIGVSLQYETNGADDCISGITGYDLCKLLLIAKILAVFCFVLFWLLLIFKNKIIRKSQLKTHN